MNSNSLFKNYDDIKLLQDLLYPKSDPDTSFKIRKPQTSYKVVDDRSILSMPCEDVSEYSQDCRKEPKYDITYCNKLTPEDIYLPFKTTHEQEELMVITILLPKEDICNVKLQVFESEDNISKIKVSGLDHFLELDLPKPVEEKSGHSKWNSIAEELVVQLPIRKGSRRFI